MIRLRKRIDQICENISSPWLVGQLTIWSLLFISSLLLTLLLRFTALSDNYLPTLSYIINVCCLFMGGYKSGKTARKKGWFYGGLQGLIYASILMMVSFLAFDDGTRLHPLFLSVWAFGLSALGGILGVNRTT